MQNRVFVMGGTGATGKHLVRILLDKGLSVTAIARSPGKLQNLQSQYSGLKILQGTVLDLPIEELRSQLAQCTAVASCLGHNLTLKGIYGQPHKLVRDSLIRTSEIVQQMKPDAPVKFVLMNTTGNRNPDSDPPVSSGHRLIVGMLRALLPPHSDNEQAAEYLRTGVGRDNAFCDWCVVRPDTLIDERDPTAYTLHASPTRDPILNAGQTSRVNVADFMSRLILDDELWSEWRGKMPVIYNQEMG